MAESYIHLDSIHLTNEISVIELSGTYFQVN